MNCIKCNVTLYPDSVYCHICGKKQGAEPRKHRKRANGTGTVTKLPGNRAKPYRARKDGVHIGYFKLEREAWAALNALAGKQVSGKYNMTFKEVYEAWKDEHYRDISGSSAALYDTAYAQFKGLHDRPFRTLRAADFQRCVDFYAYKENNGIRNRSRSTCSNLKKLIGQMSKYAIREEIAATSFSQFLKLPAAAAVKKEKELFTASDIARLKSSLDDAAKIVLILIYTGMRIGELFSLRRENVFEKHCVGGIKTDAGKNRVIPIPPDVRPYFKYFHELSAGRELLLDGYTGNHNIKNFRKRDYAPMLEYLGISYKTPHCTRHTYASLAVESGMRQEHLQKILGHASYVTSADIYIHADMDALISAAESLSVRKAAK